MPFSLSLSTLYFKVVAPGILLLQNLYSALRKYNETWLLITWLKRRYIKIQILKGKFNS